MSERWRPVRWTVLGLASGVLAGASSWLFLTVLDRVTSVRGRHAWLIYLLPIAGVALASVYHAFGGEAARGNALLIEQVHTPSAWVPRRMAPLVLVGTWVTHLFGGSAGREGTAVQMSGSLSDGVARLLRLGQDDRAELLVAALAGGFGAVFGVPLAGAVFALEVQPHDRVRGHAIVPALAAAVVGDAVVDALGYAHTARASLTTGLDPWLVARLAVAGVAFGAAATAFVALTHAVRMHAGRTLPWPPLRAGVGGAAVVGLAVLCGREYLGLSLPLADAALAGAPVGWSVFALKIAFTAITLGSGFVGGEVTPLFVVGATLGGALAPALGLDPAMVATVGFVAVFSAAAHVPLTCTIMAAELFGSGAVVPAAVGCGAAYLFALRRRTRPLWR